MDRERERGFWQPSMVEGWVRDSNTAVPVCPPPKVGLNDKRRRRTRLSLSVTAWNIFICCYSVTVGPTSSCTSFPIHSALSHSSCFLRRKHNLRLVGVCECWRELIFLYLSTRFILIYQNFMCFMSMKKLCNK